MVKAMDHNPDKVLAYSNYHFKKNDDIIFTVINEAWNFEYFLSGFGCPAAGIGTFIRRSSFKDWKYLKSNKFLYINDLEMYWNMALVGEFLYVPFFSGAWTIHNGQISRNRVDSIDEIKQWYNEYFSKNNIPKNILNVKDKTKQSIIKYFINIYQEEPNINIIDKIYIIRQYKKELNYDFTNLQINLIKLKLK